MLSDTVYSRSGALSEFHLDVRLDIVEPASGRHVCAKFRRASFSAILTWRATLSPREVLVCALLCMKQFHPIVIRVTGSQPVQRIHAPTNLTHAPALEWSFHTTGPHKPSIRKPLSLSNIPHLEPQHPLILAPHPPLSRQCRFTISTLHPASSSKNDSGTADHHVLPSRILYLTALGMAATVGQGAPDAERPIRWVSGAGAGREGGSRRLSWHVQWCPRVRALSALTSLGITGQVVSSTLHKPAQIDKHRLSLILQIRSLCQEELSSSENCLHGPLSPSNGIGPSYFSSREAKWDLHVWHGNTVEIGSHRKAMLGQGFSLRSRSDLLYPLV
jgi:hypothetical protein